MQDNIPDALEQFEQYEAEQERVHRRIKQNAHEWALAEAEEFIYEDI